MAHTLMACLRMRKALRQDELGRILGISQPRISGIERGELQPSQDEAIALVKFLCRPLQELFEPVPRELPNDHREYMAMKVLEQHWIVLRKMIKGSDANGDCSQDKYKLIIERGLRDARNRLTRLERQIRRNIKTD